MHTEVYKFGGASIKDAEGIRNVASIISSASSPRLLIIASAMAGVTDQLERVVKLFIQGHSDSALERLGDIRNFHYQICIDLFGDQAPAMQDQLSNILVEVEWILEEPVQDAPDYIYDQIVSVGELLSTLLVAEYLRVSGTSVRWVDARNFIKTDNSYRSANVDWQLTGEAIKGELDQLLESQKIITQGFIGSSSENFTTTLGRDGSDYSAGIFCAALDARSLTIWKDVPGVLNADPKWFDETEQIPELTYQDAIELSYYGATVIHPKTLKPLQNKHIPLYVRSFKDPTAPGTKITGDKNPLPVPSFIFKVNQVLLSIFPKDFSFIIEENLSEIFNIFHSLKISVNTMFNSALSFSVSVDDDPENIDALITKLGESFKVKYNRGLELVTIRYYDQATIDRISANKKILLEVKSRYTCQMVVRDKTDAES